MRCWKSSIWVDSLSEPYTQTLFACTHCQDHLKWHLFINWNKKIDQTSENSKLKLTFKPEFQLYEIIGQLVEQHLFGHNHQD